MAADESASAAAAVCMRNSRVEGDVTLGSGCVLCPFARVEALDGCGALALGRSNVVGSHAAIFACGDAHQGVAVGDCNVFGAHCRVEASRVGSGNVFGAHCRVVRGCVVGSGCVVLPGVVLPEGAALADGTVAYADAATGCVAFKEPPPHAEDAIAAAVRRNAAFASSVHDTCEAPPVAIGASRARSLRALFASATSPRKSPAPTHFPAMI